jgi:hypothetical protein
MTHKGRCFRGARRTAARMKRQGRNLALEAAARKATQLGFFSSFQAAMAQGEVALARLISRAIRPKRDLNIQYTTPGNHGRIDGGDHIHGDLHRPTSPMTRQAARGN